MHQVEADKDTEPKRIEAAVDEQEGTRELAYSKVNSKRAEPLSRVYLGINN